MLSGKPPFHGESEYLTFKQIEKRELIFPAAFDATAKDLVDALLQLEPKKRLGYDSYDALKAHAFFRGVDWKAIFSQPAPQLPDSDPLKKQPKEIDEETLVASVTAAATASANANKEKEKEKEKETTNANAKEKEKEKLLNKGDVSAADREKWGVFLLADEKILFTGLINKRGKIGDSVNLTGPRDRRQLILTAFPRLVYCDPTTNMMRGEICGLRSCPPFLRVRMATCFISAPPNATI